MHKLLLSVAVAAMVSGSALAAPSAIDVGRVLAEDGGIGGQPTIFDIKIIVRAAGFQKAGQDAAERRARLFVLFLQRGAGFVQDAHGVSSRMALSTFAVPSCTWCQRSTA